MVKKKLKQVKTRWSWNNLFIALITGVLLVLAFPPFPFPLFAFIAFIPLLSILEKKPAHPNLLIYLTFFIYHAGANWWIASWQPDTDPYLMVSGIAVAFVHPALFLIPFWIYRFITNKVDWDKAIYFFPFIWVSFEWLHSLGEIAYPWLTVGYTQIYNKHWVQFADITGIWGIGFIILLTNILIFKFIKQFRDKRFSFSTLKESFGLPYYRNIIILILVIFIVPIIYGYFRIDQFDHKKLIERKNNINIALIQPSINPWKKWEIDAYSQILIHKRIQDSITDKIQNIDLAIWSETAITYLNLDVNCFHRFNFLTDWLDERKMSILTGFSDMYIYGPKQPRKKTTKVFRNDSTKFYDSFNSALMLNPAPFDKLNSQIYHKMKLTPFGERIPYLDVFWFTMKWLEWNVGISSWNFGTEQKNLILENNNKRAVIGPIICIESLYPGFVSNFVDMGAEILVVITNDAWYDYTYGPEQHYQIAAMRAIENRRYIARCGNTGVSGFIKPDGSSISRAEPYIGTSIAASIPKLNEKSLYLLFGDWLAYTCFFVMLSGIILTFFTKKTNSN